MKLSVRINNNLFTGVQSTGQMDFARCLAWEQERIAAPEAQKEWAELCS